MDLNCMLLVTFKRYHPEWTSKCMVNFTKSLTQRYTLYVHRWRNNRYYTWLLTYWNSGVLESVMLYYLILICGITQASGHMSNMATYYLNNRMYSHCSYRLVVCIWWRKICSATIPSVQLRPLVVPGSTDCEFKSQIMICQQHLQSWVKCLLFCFPSLSEFILYWDETLWYNCNIEPSGDETHSLTQSNNDFFPSALLRRHEPTAVREG